MFPFFAKARHLAEYAAVKALAMAVNLLPIHGMTVLMRTVAAILFALFPSRRRTVIQNLDMAYGDALSPGEKKAIAKECYENVLIATAELARLPKVRNDARSRFELEGLSDFEAGFAKGKGIICVIAHFGSWEYTSFLAYLTGHPATVLVRPVKNPYIFRWIQSLRKCTSLSPVDRRRTLRMLMGELRQNHIVAVLVDQWSGHRGLWLDFFGRPTSTTSLPARLAKKTGAALLPVLCVRTRPGHYKIFVRPEISLAAGEGWEKETTLEINRWLEKEIRLRPGQWIWSHRRWKDKSRSIRPPRPRRKPRDESRRAETAPFSDSAAAESAR